MVTDTVKPETRQFLALQSLELATDWNTSKGETQKASRLPILFHPRYNRSSVSAETLAIINELYIKAGGRQKVAQRGNEMKQG